MGATVTRSRLSTLILIGLLAGAACAGQAGLSTTQIAPADADAGRSSTTAASAVDERSRTRNAAPMTPVDGGLEWREAAYVQLAADTARASQLGPFTERLANWPLNGRASSPFGPRWGGFHNGLDIAAPMYTPVQAAAAGQVVVVGKPFLAFGDTATIIVIAHGNAFATVYAHLNDERPPVVRVGQRVSAGEVIAFNGTTGWSTGPHVHFMTVVNGRPVDPRESLP